jgi:enterochelin esterase family protein
MSQKLLSLLFVLSASFLKAQDTSLHDVLIDNEGWKEAASGYTFTDGLACDQAGNVYFTDVKAGVGIYKIALDGKVSVFIDNQPGISGLHVGADGRLYACVNKTGRVVVFEKDGTVKELLANVKPNDLIVTKSGITYVTETPTKRILAIMPDGTNFIADEGHVIRPNGITLSFDQTTLAVSEHGGTHVWTWQIGLDGHLSGAEPYMTMLVSPNNAKGEALGDGSTTDEKGRYYVTTELGIQVFDQTGRLSGVIAKPSQDSKVVSVEFGGEGHQWLFVADRDKIYKRKTSTHGAWWSEAKK